ncbi:MAG: hypothetical protein JW914_00640 [Syntrophaceae bacterium]|nr:hypothetical protein [Syntrophaceae bacterium]
MENNIILIINILIYIPLLIVAFKSKDNVLKWTFISFFLLWECYAIFGDPFDSNNQGYPIFVSISLILSFFMIIKKIRNQRITWRPILTTMLFLVSYAIIVFQKGLISFGIPLYTGYILVTISFIIWLVLYRKELRFIKTYGIQKD